MNEYLRRKKEFGLLNSMERCALYHSDYHVKCENGIWFCEYCRSRRERLVTARAILLKLKLGIESSSYHVTGSSGAF